MLHKKGQEILSKQQIWDFLERVDQEFPVSLSDKTDLSVYAEKLYLNATICFESENGEIVGMLAGYTENTVNNMAYMSMLSVLPEKRGCGIAKKLVCEFLDEAAEKGLRAAHLYAVRDNISAMRLYRGLGFAEWYMESDERQNDVHFIYYLKKRTALVTAIGSFSADIVIKNLGQMGYRVVGCDIYAREWIVDAANVDAFYRVPRVSDEKSYFDAILKICEDEEVTHIIPSTDVEVDFYSKYRTEFEKKGIVICISPQKTVEICRNKMKQRLFIGENVREINTIPTVYVDEADSAPFDFPMICKPYDGRSSQGVRYIRCDGDWNAIKEADGTEKYIVQPVIDGSIITVDVVRKRDGSKSVAVPREELLRTPNGAGTSVRVFHDAELEEACRILADRLDIVGCVNFEFIHADDGKYYYVECNPRFSGGVEFSCIAGYDCVENHISGFENADIGDFTFTGEMYIARKYEEYITKTS